MKNFGLTMRAMWMLAVLATASSCGPRDGSDVKGNEASATIGFHAPVAAGVYAPTDAVAESWGNFDFYRSHATFAAFEGHLALEGAGRLAAGAGTDLAGAELFRIANSAEHFEKNRNRNGACLTAPQWLAIKPQAVTDGPQRILVALLMVENAAAYAPGKPGLCGSAAYSAS